MSAADVATERARFAADVADPIATAIGVDIATRITASTMSSRFVWYRDDENLTLVVGAHEGDDSDRALAVGLAERGTRSLILALAAGWEQPTLRRWAWLMQGLPLRVFIHDHDGARELPRLSPDDTLELVAGKEKPPLHLGDRSAWIDGLLAWATANEDLDPSHRQDVRAWQCRGQRVLKIKRKGGGLSVTAGIDWSPKSSNTPAYIADVESPLTAAVQATIIEHVEAGMRERREPSGAAHKADEHWLQAVLRRNPRTVGLEQPVLREVPAWRPRGSKESGRGRGFIDLLGLDAHGTLALIETKLGDDEMLVLQGLDYRVWTEANRDRITTRLGCRHDVPVEIVYCIAGKEGSQGEVNARTSAQLSQLGDDLRWRIRLVDAGWFSDDVHTAALPLGTVPVTP